MAPDEKQIKPPKFALTLALNQAVTDFVFNQFKAKYLSGYDVRVTSMYREPGHNEAVGGAANSAHVHGLAVDFVLYKDGKKLGPIEQAKVFKTVVLPHWHGFALDEGDHIHVNLSRAITTSMSIAAGSVAGFLSWEMVKSLLKPGKKR
jgi:hypothetical protein